MEFDSPSRFLADIDPTMMRVDSDSDSSFFSSPARASFGSYSSDRYQNSNPVASQFRADPKIREAVHREERRTDPLSPAFKRTLAAAGGNMRRIGSITSPMRPVHAAGQSSSVSSQLQVGSTIEHERFGIGSVTGIEGTGENTKATVEFRNVGTKQLLLKFAKFKVIG